MTVWILAGLFIGIALLGLAGCVAALIHLLAKHYKQKRKVKWPACAMQTEDRESIAK